MIKYLFIRADSLIKYSKVDFNEKITQSDVPLTTKPNKLI